MHLTAYVAPVAGLQLHGEVSRPQLVLLATVLGNSMEMEYIVLVPGYQAVPMIFGSRM